MRDTEPGEEPLRGPGQWLSADKRLFIGMVLTGLFSLMNPLAGLISAVIGAVVLKGRSRFAMAAVALVLVGYFLLFSTMFATGPEGVGTGSS